MQRLLAVVLALASIAAARFPIRNFPLAERLGRDLDRLDLGIARATVDNTGDLRIEGSGWKAWLPFNAGALDRTAIWTADLDRNGRRDILVLLGTFMNGRCVHHGEIASLMFDDHGRPTPWMVHTDFDLDAKNVGLVDLNGNGRAELAARECDYVPGGEDLEIRGIYEAHNSHWEPLRDAKTDLYRRLVQELVPTKSNSWTVTPPDSWPDQYRSAVAKSLRLEELTDKHCPAIGLEVVNGRVTLPERDDCGKHAHYSDGRIRKGWPSVVWDTSHGREIYMTNSEQVLLSLIRQKREIRLTGPDDEPAWIWAEEATPAK